MYQTVALPLLIIIISLSSYSKALPRALQVSAASSSALTHVTAGSRRQVLAMADATITALHKSSRSAGVRTNSTQQKQTVTVKQRTQQSGHQLSKQQLQQQIASTAPQQWSSQAPLINGWNNLQTTASVNYIWSQSLYPLGPTSFTVPWAWGTAVAKLRSTFTRSVASASSTFSGNLAIANPDPYEPIYINRVQLQCLWGANIDLPCVNSNGWRSGGMQIGAGQMSYCYVTNMPVQAVWGGNYQQPCKVVATTWNGVQSNSGMQ